MSKINVKTTIVEKLANELDGRIRGAYRQLEGELLTLIDATFTDPEQRKAQKDIVKQKIWNNRFKGLDIKFSDWLFIHLARKIGDKEYLVRYESGCDEMPDGNYFND